VKPTIHYINTDSDLVATGDLTSLAVALSSKGLFQLHVSQHDDGLWYATFETGEQFDEPEQNIAAFLRVIETLDAASRSVWSACAMRAFNIGYETGDEPMGFQSRLATATLARAVAVGASIHITLYPADRSLQMPHDTATQVAFP